MGALHGLQPCLGHIHLLHWGLCHMVHVPWLTMAVGQQPLPPRSLPQAEGGLFKPLQASQGLFLYCLLTFSQLLFGSSFFFPFLKSAHTEAQLMSLVGSAGAGSYLMWDSCCTPRRGSPCSPVCCQILPCKPNIVAKKHINLDCSRGKFQS